MLTFGADPEVFVQRNRQIVPGCGLIGGTKAKPLDLGDGYAVQEDNVMAEYNIPPVDIEEYGIHEFVDVMRTGVSKLKSHLKAAQLSPKWKTPVHEFDPNVLAEAGRQALEFGCSPEFDAYDHGAPARKVDMELIGSNRFAGGHLHVGYDGVDAPPFVVASFLDATLGLSSIAWGDKQGMRRQLYGQAGRFRPTPYGLEYRVLSNFWVYDSELLEAVAQKARGAILMLQRATPARLKQMFAEIPWVDVRRAIGTEDRRLAMRLSSYLGNEVWS